MSYYTLKLDGYELPEAPKVFSGIHYKKSRADVPTLSDNISIIWGFVLPDITVELSWPWMAEDVYETLEDKYLEAAGSTLHRFDVYADGSTIGSYNAEIVDFFGAPYENYRSDVKMTLKLMEEV
ncbi:MAG: hypothetical protein ACTSPB_01915 [Candidatus Thorarchaeota archaeon]